MDRDSYIEAELTLRRYKPHGGSLTEHPDQEVVFNGVKIFEPTLTDPDEIIDGFKLGVQEKVQDYVVANSELFDDAYPEPARGDSIFPKAGL